ncbi:MAG TPA: choice-of-anchor Q domain-containing protein, partial [Anaerolineae bacterium]|nr:choice-of-anchor Q domain-containing protein [Anaerolineae bacterium]
MKNLLLDQGFMVHKRALMFVIVLSCVALLLFTLFLPTAFKVQAANFDLTGSCLGGVGDVAALIAAINAANGNGEADTITLAEGCVYTLDEIDNATDGNNGLPSITSAIVIQAGSAGSTIRRDVADPDEFRLFHIADDGDLTLENLTLQHGVADEGGAIYNAGGVLTLNNATIADNASIARGGGIATYGALTINDSTLTRNSCPDNFGGGGLYAGGGGDAADSLVTIHRSVFADNVGYEGGGIATRQDGGFPVLLTIHDSTFSGNQATGQWGSGGGVSSNGDLSIAGSTFVSNTATSADGTGGGGLAHINGTAWITNSTFSGNRSATDGGGIYFRDMAMTLSYATIAYNTADSDNDGVGGGGVYIADWGGTFNVASTLIAHNTDRSGQGPDCFTIDGSVTPLTSQGYNLIQNDTGCTIAGDTTGNLTGSDPLIGTAQDNGGPTWTHALLIGSPAQDRVPNGTNGCDTTITSDQRGTARPQPAGGACDSGAYESPPTYIITPTAGAGGSLTPGTPQT